MRTVLAFLAAVITLQAKSQTYLWTDDHQESYYETSAGQVLTAANGNAYVVGSYKYVVYHALDIDGRMLRKYDKHGTLMWEIKSETEFRWRICFAPNGDLILLGIDGSGQFMSVVDKQTGTIGQKKTLLQGGVALSACYDSQGNLILGGVYQYSMTAGTNTYFAPQGGNNVLFVAKYDQSQNLTWLLGSQGEPYKIWIIVDSNDDILISGDFHANFSFGTTTLTNSNYPWDMYAGYIGKVSSSGNLVWLRMTGDAGHAADVFENVLSSDLSGNLWICGATDKTFVVGSSTLTPSTPSKFEMFIAKYDAGGNGLWAKMIPSPVSAGASHIMIRNGAVYLSGGYGQTVDFGNGHVLQTAGICEGFLAKLDDNGVCRWAIDVGGQSDAKSVANSTDYRNGYLYVTGWFQGNVSFDEPASRYGADNMFTSRISDADVTKIPMAQPSRWFSVYPNPVNEKVTISGAPWTGDHTTLEISNYLGQAVMSSHITGEDFSIDVGPLPGGVYTIKSISGYEHYHSRFVKAGR
jgi:hypothetical protein